MNDQTTEVIVIGAGLSGLYCAALLAEAGRRVSVLEASDAVGGRVRTDIVDGFTLNRGFQVFLDSYPEAARALDYQSLDLRPFNSGAAVWTGQRFEHLFDPTRHPSKLKDAITSPLLTWGDRIRAIKLWSDVRFGDANALLTEGEETTTMAELLGRGFSQRSIDSFFRPFFGGVLLSPDLTTSNRLFEYLFRMFATGRATLPAKGMQAIPEQLAARARRAGATIELNTQVQRIDDGAVLLETGERRTAKATVIATESDAAAHLLGESADVRPRGWNGEWTFYFAANQPPLHGPTLVLNGLLGSGPVNDLAVISEAVPAYAPEGQSLISTTVIGRLEEEQATLEAQVRLQLAPWFGTAVADWKCLKAYRITRGLPDFTPPESTTPKPVKLRPGVFLCGDHREQASIQGALVAGRRAAEAVSSC